ncbi:Aspartyl/glutamyl-tRNA(Asn/Gln) amidotransferase subunit B [Candidatus Kinetoplastibacterium sorsogonicusi]|uniref:Aspartyl/glutamyl-tRNA(Asn/Gln) amidotransferase subunit B n=1 Tax=Candidatus Kinetoplastidibacterium kentomonadis TaxID=1576550 RepID=A0A3S7JAP8_9PROT|nr:Asp-tRNA(Asn)/Glu-tRNA(Gln) amidotransferase subunit GatB [Candidatus Kinetoplastibacterium sorsogonicusi]AWD32740.1 Aspartyl/glutamyl-tRNA(Asn/Gln) amidotransferase subunit B [Candidatus Kinetoplastibacterium sorsogonicusi]
MKWEIVIGLETHIRLLTNSKLFSDSSNHMGSIPNKNINAVDVALPGTLPILNEKAVEYAIIFGLATNSKISNKTMFARKNYFYPDLPKGYQISQLDMPITSGGKIFYKNNEIEKNINITRAHLEEDAGKSIHGELMLSNGNPSTGIDLNRAGSTLLEIVTEPELRSVEDTVAYAKTLHHLVKWLGICDGNMQDGSFRCDINISVRKYGDQKLGTRTEIKNLNSFKFMEQAIKFECNRQINILENGGIITQETRLYDPIKNITVCMRNKENSHGYRYFNDPDILPLNISDDFIKKIKNKIPELPQICCKRFQNICEISLTDAKKLTANREIANYFDKTINLLNSKSLYKIAANLILGDITYFSNKESKDVFFSKISHINLANIVKRIGDNTISYKIAKEIIEGIWNNKFIGEIDEIIFTNGLKQIDDMIEFEKIIDDIIQNNDDIVKEFLSGKEKALNSLVGKIMKITKGKINPQKVLSFIKEKIYKKY